MWSTASMESAATTTAIAAATAPLKTALLCASPRSRPMNSFIGAGTQKRLRLRLATLLQHPGGAHGVVSKTRRNGVHGQRIVRAVELDHIGRTAMDRNVGRDLEPVDAGGPRGL